LSLTQGPVALHIAALAAYFSFSCSKYNKKPFKDQKLIYTYMNPIEQNRLLSQDLAIKDYVGEVIDTNDPEKEFRCKIRVYGLFDDIEDEKLPWAYPGGNTIFGGKSGGFGSGSVPKKGALVKVKFANGDLYSPEYMAMQNINPALKAELGDDYEGTHVLAYDEDEDLKILYQKGTGLKIHLKDSHITINPDTSITIEHSQSQSIIELVGDTCNVVTNARQGSVL
jgi:hypothetical protein